VLPLRLSAILLALATLRLRAALLSAVLSFVANLAQGFERVESLFPECFVAKMVDLEISFASALRTTSFVAIQGFFPLRCPLGRG